MPAEVAATLDPGVPPESVVPLWRELRTARWVFWVVGKDFSSTCDKVFVLQMQEVHLALYTRGWALTTMLRFPIPSVKLYKLRARLSPLA